MLQSFMIYFSLAIVISTLAEFSSRAVLKKHRVICGCLVVLISSFMAGVRYETGTDYYTYVNAFNNPDSKEMVEIGYGLMTHFIDYIGGDIELVFFIMSCITMTCVLLSLLENKSKLSVGLGMFIFMMLYYQMSYNLMRQISAVSIVVYAINFIHKRELLKFTALVLAATTIHYSSIIILPFYFILDYLSREGKANMRIVFFVVLIFFYLNAETIFMPIFQVSGKLIYYSGYFMRNPDGQIGLGMIAEFLPYVLCCWLLYKDFKEDKIFVNYYIMFLIGLILETSTYLYLSEAASRIALMFLMPLYIIIPMCVEKFLDKKQHIPGIVMVAFVILSWYNTYFYRGYNETVPYQWILSSSYEVNEDDISYNTYL